MTQTARPIADISTGGWTPTPIWSRIDEVSPDDGDFVTGDIGEAFEVKLSPLQTPEAETTTLYVRIKLNNDANCALIPLVDLLEGSKVIGAGGVIGGAGGSFSTHMFQFNSQLVSDYSNLSIRVSSRCATCTLCSNFPPMRTISATLSGVADAGCTTCVSSSNLNKKHNFPAAADGCTWPTVAVSSGCTPDIVLSVQLDSKWIVSARRADTGALLAQWETSNFSSFPIDCAAEYSCPTRSVPDNTLCDFSAATCVINKP